MPVLGKLRRTIFCLYLGIAQIAVRPPLPALKRALWGTFFRALFEGLYGSNRKKGAPNRLDKGLAPSPPHTIVGKKRDLGVLDPMIFSGKIQKNTL